MNGKPDRTTCVSAKIRYADELAARKAKKHVNRTIKRARTKRAYYCQWCYGWHLTKQRAPK